MIVTPSSFKPLVAPVSHHTSHTFAFRGAELLVREADAALPDTAAARGLGIDDATAHVVGLLGETYCRAVSVPAGASPPEGYAFTPMRRLWTRMDDALLAVAGRAFQIVEWARTHRFCGVCGQPMVQVPGERAMKCACGHTAYPR
ncbi:MAG: NUDIX-like domain-containing protein, partial [Bacillota bacterium]